MPGQVRFVAAPAVLALALLVPLSPAGAAERKGTTEIDLDGRRIVHSFTISEDSATGTLRRSGTVSAGPGLAISYEMTGTCLPDRSRCDLAGTGTGPQGRTWTGTGTLVRTGETSTFRATLTGPAGREITVVRTVDGPADPILLP